MRALVTGGSGFIGSNIVELLLDEDYEVVVLDNLSSGYRKNLEPLLSVELIVGDVRDVDTVARAMEGVDVVFHLAASVGNMRSLVDPVTDSEVNVLGTLRVLEAAREAGVRKIVHSSSAAIYGELKTLPICEDHPLEPDSPYGASKLGGEKLALAYAKVHAMGAICLRYFNVYGRNQRYDAYGNVIPIFATQMLRGESITIFGDGEQTRDFVNVRDVARANIQAAQADGVRGAFNIASGSRVTLNQLAELMSEAGGLEPSVGYGPPRPGDIRHSLADVSAAATGFGYAPSVGLAEGLAEYMVWMREEGLCDES